MRFTVIPQWSKSSTSWIVTAELRAAAANAALFDALREHSGSNVVLKEFDLHVNDEQFVEERTKELLSMLTGRGEENTR